MAQIEVRARSAPVKRSLERLREAIRDFEPALEEIGERLVKNVQGRFHRSTTPTGRPWPRSKAARKANRRTLIRTGRLLRSFESDAGDTRVQVGTDLPYARAHQLGAYIRPRRRSADPARYKSLAVRVRVDKGGRARVGLRSVSRTRPPEPGRRPTRGHRIPRRPFLGLSRRDRAQIRDIVARRIAEAVT